MSVYDPDQISVLIGDYRITEFDGSADAISAKMNGDRGELVMAGSKGVFVRKTDRSGTLTLKLKQHGADIKYLNDLMDSQEDLKSFTPLSLKIQDLLNQDKVSGDKGFFTVNPDFNRGEGHNPNSFTIAFERMSIKLEKGHGN